MTRSSLPISLAILLAAGAAMAGESTPWPQTQAEHQAFFCGADNASETAPVGYANAMLRELAARTRKGMTMAAAVDDVRASADCRGAIARGAMKTDQVRTLVKLDAKR